MLKVFSAVKKHFSKSNPSNSRGTSKVRKDEIESLSMQLLREKGQVFV